MQQRCIPPSEIGQRLQRNKTDTNASGSCSMLASAAFPRCLPSVAHLGRPVHGQQREVGDVLQRDVDVLADLGREGA